MRAQSVDMNSEHAMASAAIPLLFPAVEIDGAYYCDGGLRQNTPLSPAIPPMERQPELRRKCTP